MQCVNSRDGSLDREKQRILYLSLSIREEPSIFDPQNFSLALRNTISSRGSLRDNRLVKNASCSRKVNRVYFRSLDRDSWTLVLVPAVAPFRSQVDRNGDAPLLFLYYQRSSPRCYCLLGQHDRYCVLYKLTDISPIFLTPRLRISCERCDIKLRATNAYFFSIRADIFS